MQIMFLTQELKKSGENQKKVIEGVFLGLASFLKNFSHLYPINHAQKVRRLGFIFQAVKTSLFINPEEKRYDLVRGALKLLTVHAELFAPMLLEQCEELVQLLAGNGCNHGNQEVRVKSGLAFEAVMTQLCGQIVGEQRGMRERNVFHFLLKYFNTQLDANKTVDDVSMSIRAFGQLARGIAVYMSQGELVKFLHKLLQISQRLFTGSSDNMQKSVRQFPAFISAYAFILKELDRNHLDANVLLELSKMMVN